MTIQGTFCPNCGHKRLGSFRFCTNCKFDFDAGAIVQVSTSYEAPPAAPVAPAAKPVAVDPAAVALGPATKGGWVLIPILVVVGIGIAVLLVASGKLNSSPGIAAVNLPPVGEAWFGTAFDPTTFALSGQSTSFAVGQSVAVVGHLSTKIAEGQAIVISVDGYQFSSGKGGSGGSDAFAIVVPPGWFGGAPGPSHKVAFTDDGGNVLASGTVSIGP